MATLPPPITTTFLPMLKRYPRLAFSRKSIPLWTPSRSTPGIERSRLRCAPTASTTASKPCSRSPETVKSRPAAEFNLRVTSPVSRISRICASTTLRGRRYSGMPRLQHAAGHRSRFEDGHRVAQQRQIVRRRKPHRPAADDGHAVAAVSSTGSRRDFQRMPRLRPVAFGRENASARESRWAGRSRPRRQAVSHGCAHTRPQTLAIGLGSRA